MAKRTKRTMHRGLRFVGGGTHTGTEHTMSAYGCRAHEWSKTLLHEKTEENSTTLGIKSKKEVKKLLKSGVIERIPANKAAQWISPAGFVAKDKKEEKLRLVCDLRQLNKSCKSDTSIFPTLNKVMQSLSSTSQFFVKADILQGYHQIALSDKSRNLFCFTLEDSLYRYTRAP